MDSACLSTNRLRGRHADPIISLEATAPKMIRICRAEDGEVFHVRLHTLAPGVPPLTDRTDKRNYS